MMLRRVLSPLILGGGREELISIVERDSCLVDDCAMVLFLLFCVVALLRVFESGSFPLTLLTFGLLYSYTLSNSPVDEGVDWFEWLFSLLFDSFVTVGDS
jgi:hypothetical protein